MPLRSLLLLLLCSAPALGEYMQPELEEVPLARLIENLETKLKARPNDVGLLHNLARTHAMAYARKLARDEAVKTEHGAPWFGYEPPRLPFGAVEDAEDDAAREAAAAHLTRALELYAQALKKRPQDAVLRLGRAWCLVQADRRDEALPLLRALVAEAWEQEKDNEYGGLEEFLTAEAGRYLISLLDSEADADEVAAIQEKIATLEALPRPVTPLALPLQAGLTPADLLDREARVAFDLDASGRAGQRWSWIRPSAAWLVHDPGARGRITSGLQLFGSRSFHLFHRDAYEALSLLDDDRDGWLRGRELRGLALWRDADGDGQSDPGEVRPLAAHGVVGLACQGEEHASGIPWSPRGVELADGSRRPSFDLILEPR